MISEELLFIGICDISGKVRGRAIPKNDLHKHLEKGVGWVPANALATCFDPIGEGFFGSMGDLTIRPDLSTTTTLDFQDGGPEERIVLGDIVNLDGTSSNLCVRSILRTALDRLEKIAGIRLMGSFEHEFQFTSHPQKMGQAFSWQGFSEQRVFNSTLVAALRQAGMVPDTILKEYGPNQYEVTVAPDVDMKIADSAVLLRELVHATAQHTEQAVTFTPLTEPSAVGNGVHVHLSMLDHMGRPVTYDPDGQNGMAKVTASFAAGILKYLDRIIAITAPSVISYDRLAPHRWSAAYNNLGVRDREASLRICPVTGDTPEQVARQYNLEFRAADAAASPYLVLAAIVNAGVQGIEEDLPAPEVVHDGLSTMREEDLKKKGISRLPSSLEDALNQLQKDETVRSWFPEQFVDVYVAHKQAEIKWLKEHKDIDPYDAYQKVY